MMISEKFRDNIEKFITDEYKTFHGETMVLNAVLTELQPGTLYRQLTDFVWCPLIEDLYLVVFIGDQMIERGRIKFSFALTTEYLAHSPRAARHAATSLLREIYQYAFSKLKEKE